MKQKVRSSVVNSATEVIVQDSKCRLHALVAQDATTAGTIAILDGATTLFTLAIGSLVKGQELNFHGLKFENSLRLNCSVAEPVIVLYERDV